MTSKRELETVSAILMLLAGIFMLLGPIQEVARAVQRGTLNLDLVDVLVAVVALASFAIVWKGNSTAGGLLGLIVSLYVLFGRGSSGGLEAASAALLLAGGIIAMLAGRSQVLLYPTRLDN